MARADIPTHVRQVIVRHIDSAQQVEILALLLRDPAKQWRPAEVSRSLHIPPEACEGWLEGFAAAGLVGRADEAAYSATPARESRTVAELVDLYGRRRISVVDTIYNKSGSAIQSFSDAFKLRGND